MKIFVINLDRRRDRWTAVSDHLHRLGLEFTRVEAIDGLALEDHDDTSLVPRAVDACWRSHRRVYALVAQSPGNTNCLVLEDDAVLNSQVNWTEFLGVLDRYMTQALIDVLQLGFLEPMHSTSTKIEVFVRNAVSKALDIAFRRGPDDGSVRKDNRWDCLAHAPGNLALVPDSFVWGTHCYAISSRAAKAFLPLNLPPFTPPDSFFVCIAKDQEDYRRIKIARVKRSLAIQRSRTKAETVDSDLEVVDLGVHQNR